MTYDITWKAVRNGFHNPHILFFSHFFTVKWEEGNGRRRLPILLLPFKTLSRVLVSSFKGQVQQTIGGKHGQTCRQGCWAKSCWACIYYVQNRLKKSVVGCMNCHLRYWHNQSNTICCHPCILIWHYLVQTTTDMNERERKSLLQRPLVAI